METITEKANNAAKAENKDFAYVEAILADGTPVKVSKQTVKNLMSESIKAEALQNGIFILYYKNKGNNPTFAKLSDWAALQRSGEVAVGVTFEEGNKLITVATKGIKNVTWSTKDCGNLGPQSIQEAYKDWDGQKNQTDFLRDFSDSFGEGTAFTVCASYAKVNVNGEGLKAGNWWLPSMGELIAIYNNVGKINYALSLIDGADSISMIEHWSSTNLERGKAWAFNFFNGSFNNWENKVTKQMLVRPVAYI